MTSLAIRLHLFSCLMCNNAKWKYRDFSTDRWSQQPGPECCLNGGGNAPDTVNSVYLYTYVSPSSTSSTNERDAHWISANDRAVHCKVTFWDRDKSGNSLMSLWSPKTGSQNTCRQSSFNLWTIFSSSCLRRGIKRLSTNIFCHLLRWRNQLW